WIYVSLIIIAIFFFFFFFQAEDGIRDGHVTGVQTCALPISAKFKPGNHATVAELVDAQDLGFTPPYAGSGPYRGVLSFSSVSVAHPTHGPAQLRHTQPEGRRWLQTR